MSCISKITCFLANYVLHSLQPGRNVEPQGSKWVSFTKRSEWFGMKSVFKQWTRLSQSEAFLPLSLGCSDVARKHDIILSIKGKCVRTLGHFFLALGSWHLVSAQETECSVVNRKVGLSLGVLAAASMVRMPLCLIICLACSGRNSPHAATTSSVEEIDISLN